MNATPVVISPKDMLKPTAPAVGIFWLVGDALLIDRSVLDDAEAYGDCITHAAGHYERWEEWQALGAHRLAQLGYPTLIASTEYEAWPRGRIVYEVPPARFILYADRRLQRPEIVSALKTHFGLNDSTVLIKNDAHYR